MFTGLVEEMGTVRSVRRAGRSMQIAIAAPEVSQDLGVGDSVAVNGVCLTAVQVWPGGFSADVMPATFLRTNLQDLRPGDPVNLERSLRVGSRLGGHLVQGHVDGMGRVEAVAEAEIARVLTISAPPEILRYLVPRGSVAVDGVSLTVVGVTESTFEVSLIPHTARVTVLGRRRVGDRVNLEVDLIGKYVERLLAPWQSSREGRTPRC
ncbi:MAG: riboflavin synthase [Firmicutes bacterium]|nr:riboflavin synthase [Bacillota bacterium]